MPKPRKPSTRRRSQAKRVLGWREWVRLPQVGIQRIKAKIDTGARTSALHAMHIEYLTVGKKQMVRFVVHPKQKSSRIEISAVAELLEERIVKTSPGHSTLRPVIRTLLEIGESRIPIELTLINRDIMGFRMLIGRQAVRKAFLIDPEHSFLLGRPQKSPGDLRPETRKNTK